MADGMTEFPFRTLRSDWPHVTALDYYCDHMSGVGGEMLTSVFCEDPPAAAPSHDALMPRAVSFGQGLQTANIV